MIATMWFPKEFLKDRIVKFLCLLLFLQLIPVHSASAQILLPTIPHNGNTLPGERIGLMMSPPTDSGSR